MAVLSFYATGTKPRHYFNVGDVANKETEAIRQLHEWKKAKGYTPEKLEEQQRKNEIHQKAVRLIEEGFCDAEIRKKAKELIANDRFVKKELLERAKEIVKRT